jgi:fructose-1,6-bisphosphatase/inositol monophosphatase family enzyme
MGGVAAWRYLPEPVRSTVACNLTKVAGSWDFRCAAHQYRALASGHCHFLLFNRLMPWDHLPGWLLHQEAGGFSAKFDESPYEPGDVGGGLICASDRASWEAVRKGLLGNTVASAKK